MLNINVLKFINININIEFLNFIKDEILIVDFFILFFSILYFKQILEKIKLLSKNILLKNFYLIIFIGVVGIIISVFNILDKPNNLSFICL